MAEVVQIDIPGIGLVEARNAASEKTLSDILKILEEFDKKMLKGTGGGATSTSGKKESDNSNAQSGPGGLRKATKVLTHKIGVVIGGFAALGEESTRAVSNLANLGDSLESVANLFSGIPVAGAVFSAVASASERVVRAFNDVSQSGATFGGSLNSFASSASQAGMTLTEFGSLIRSNGQGMLAFGNTVESGAKRFVEISKQLRATGSDLYALGFSTQEINKGLASYGELMRMQGLRGNRSTADLAAGASRYLKNLDALAKITGEERSAKEAELKALAASAQFQASMAGLNEDVRESFAMTVTALPKELQGFAEDLLATGTATTEESQLLLSQMGQSGAMLTEFHAKMQRGEAITIEERNRLNNLIAKEAPAALQGIKQAIAANAALAPLGKGLASALKMQTDAVKGASKEQQAAQEASDRVNEAINKMRERIAEVSNTFQMFLVNSGALDSMMTMFEGLVNFVKTYVIPVFSFMVATISLVVDVIQSLVAPAMNMFGSMVKTAADIIEQYVKPALLTFAGFLIADVMPVLESLRDGFVFAMDMIQQYVLPAMQTLGQVIADYVFPAFEAIATFIANNLQPILLGLGVSFIAYKAVVMAITAKNWILSGGLGKLAFSVGLAAGKFVAMSLPLIKFTLLATAIVGIFTALYKSGWSFGTAIEAVKDNMERFGMSILEFIDNIKTKLPEWAGGISKEEADRRKTANDALRKELNDREKLRDEERAEVAKGRTDTAKAEARQNAVKDMSFKLDQKRLGQQQDQIRAAEKAKELDLNDPYALLKGLAEKEGSGFVSGAEGSRRTMESEAEQKRTEENRKKEEQQRQQQQQKEQTSPTQTPPAQTQEIMLAAINRLNSNIEQMVAHQARTNAVLNTQLRVQENMAGNMSSDLFHSIGA